MTRKALFEAVRPFANGYRKSETIGLVNQLADHLGLAPETPAQPAPALPAIPIPGRLQTAPVAPSSEPSWVAVARKLIGTREVPGPQHNSFISKGWARLGAGWFNDDETPWCGFFVAHCMEAAGISYPGKGLFARAKAWLDWGNNCSAIYGAVVVFGREGGGHVGFLVGESRVNFYVLGGNQSNAVNITPIAKSRALGFRWPASVPGGTKKLPEMSGGTISRNEA
jgi:uncharacterized protein (TIGR02594 family)